MRIPRERGMNTPIGVARAVDAMALKSREIAAEHEVPMLQNPPLAPPHGAVDIDEENRSSIADRRANYRLRDAVASHVARRNASAGHWRRPLRAAVGWGTQDGKG